MRRCSPLVAPARYWDEITRFRPYSSMPMRSRVALSQWTWPLPPHTEQRPVPRSVTWRPFSSCSPPPQAGHGLPMRPNVPMPPHCVQRPRPLQAGHASRRQAPLVRFRSRRRRAAPARHHWSAKPATRATLTRTASAASLVTRRSCGQDDRIVSRPAKLVGCLVHGNDVLGRADGLDIVARSKDVAAARTQNADVVAHFLAHFCRCAKW